MNWLWLGKKFVSPSPSRSLLRTRRHIPGEGHDLGAGSAMRSRLYQAKAIQGLVAKSQVGYHQGIALAIQQGFGRLSFCGTIHLVA